MAHSIERRAIAVGRVLAGESRRKVSADMGIAHSTIREWLRRSESSETAEGQEVATRARAIADDIEHHETLARHALVLRICDLAGVSDDLAAVANAYAKLSDKALLRAGEPTSITKSVSRMDEEIDKMLSEMAEREGALAGDGDSPT